MKKDWFSRLWVRIVAVIVFVVMVGIAVLCALGIWACVEEDVYVDGGAQLRRDALSSLAFHRDGDVENYYRECVEDDEADEWTKQYYADIFSREKTNYFFQVKDPEGKVVLSSYSAPYQYHSSGSLEATWNRMYVDKTFDSAAKRQAWLEDFTEAAYMIWDIEQWEAYAGDGLETLDGAPLSGTVYYLSIEYSEDSGYTLERYIADIPDSVTRQIFEYRFANCLPWEQVAACMGGDNKGESVRKRCYRYLKSTGTENVVPECPIDL